MCTCRETNHKGYNLQKTCHPNGIIVFLCRMIYQVYIMSITPYLQSTTIHAYKLSMCFDSFRRSSLIRYCNAQKHRVIYCLGFIINNFSIGSCRLHHFVFYFNRTEYFIEKSSLPINRSLLIGFAVPPV